MTQNDFLEILNGPDKLEFTDEEKNEIYFQYAKNLLIASKEFKNLDTTWSNIFLTFSKLMLENVNKEKIPDVDMALSKINVLPDAEKQIILDELASIEDELKNMQKD